jgi:hypothetical protein
VGLSVVLAGLGLAVGTVAWLWRSLQSAGSGYVARLDAQEAEIEDLRRQIHELRESRINDHALLQDWITHARRLAAMFTEATGKEPPPEPQTQRRDVAAPVTAVTTPAALLKLMCDAFDRDEVDGLVFEMGLGRNVRGDSTEDRARSLIERGATARAVDGVD